MTVRQAVSSLEQEGLIRREPGRGTFVTDQIPEFSGDLELDRSIEDLISMGQATSVELLELTQIKASRDEIRDLEVVEGSEVIRCRRLRYFKGQPYCYIVNRLPEEIGGRIPEYNWCHGSVLGYIEESLGVPLQIAKQRIRATLADANMARWLQVRVGAPLLVVNYHIRSNDDRPVETARLYYRSDLYSFTLHFTRSNEERHGKNGKSWALEGPRFEH
jgi:GntR family transcriptional regulator